MLQFFRTAAASDLGVMYAMPPGYTAVPDYFTKATTIASFAAVGVAMIIPWQKYDSYKKNCIATYTCVLALTHYAITKGFVSGIQAVVGTIFFYLLAYGLLFMLNTRSSILELTSIASTGYLTGCQLSIFLGFSGVIQFLIAVLLGIVISFGLSRMNKDSNDLLGVLFTGWILFCLIDVVSFNKLIDQVANGLLLSLIPRIVLLLLDALAVFVVRNKKKVEEIQNDAVEKTNEMV
ncbi:hypothetical protein ECANGB1_1912 [Enterospora canceri]|uniref:Uncharacterized protein n=1 Tax=Enterospora canceri TaxID=1081671 RepID=A0A1Y1S8Y1_9MICR|nr:hypothetical protein ECANGB1_1912 [Enterospora canceri]